MYKIILSVVFVFVGLLNAQSVHSTNNKINIFSDSSFTKTDSLLINDSLLVQIKPDSIAPIYSTILTKNSFVISKNYLLHNDYKYTGDFLRSFPFNFLKDLGFTGQPNETFLYGVGDNSISYLIDGISINDRYSNSLNLNLIQSEDIDSIEIIPLPRGFLYGTYSNPVSVNFITNDFITKQPYTRIRFYQGANRNMMFDGSFNARVTNRLIAAFNITNRILDETYDATEYSIWQGKFKLKYLLSNDVNIIATYNYNDYKTGYSGGVDVDSIKSYSDNVDDVLYNFREAPMLYPNGELKTLTHLPRLRVLATPTYWLKTDASIFYLYNENEKMTFRKDYYRSKTIGINIRNDVQYDFLNFQLNTDFESRETYSSRSIYDRTGSSIIDIRDFIINYNTYSLSGIVTTSLFDSLFKTSFYLKASYQNIEIYNSFLQFIDKTHQGIGMDLMIKLNTKLNLYSGISMIKNYNSNNFNKVLVEIGALYQCPDLSVIFNYFINQHQYDLYLNDLTTNNFSFGNVRGLGIKSDFSFWKFLVEVNSSYYTSISDSLSGVPQFQTQTGLYYKDILFDNNLDLKTGFIFYYTGKNNVFTYENGLVEVPSSNKLDFTLVGEIQKTAIVYFTWQNLLGSNYYLTPYYPMPGSSLRFGVAWEMFN